MARAELSFGEGERSVKRVVESRAFRIISRAAKHGLAGAFSDHVVVASASIRFSTANSF